MDIFDFALTDEEMEQIAKLDKNERYYHRTDEQLVQFANWKPEFENNMEQLLPSFYLEVAVSKSE